MSITLIIQTRLQRDQPLTAAPELGVVESESEPPFAPVELPLPPPLEELLPPDPPEDSVESSSEDPVGSPDELPLEPTPP